MKKSAILTMLEKKMQTENEAIDRFELLIKQRKAKLEALEELLYDVKEGETENENPE